MFSLTLSILNITEYYNVTHECESCESCQAAPKPDADKLGAIILVERTSLQVQTKNFSQSFIQGDEQNDVTVLKMQ